ncbi:MAG: energy-coupling factor transporter transmembrane protein EcfT [Firmicutes bacterium]|nr:energy-coupling factor transporter transmembrane protein EcfT [Bacillota bacterium]
MLKEKLLLGQYYPADSPVHRLTAHCKILVTLLYMIALFVADDWLGWAVMTAVGVGAVLLSRVPFKAIWRGMKIIIFFCVLTLLLNLFMYPGDTVLWTWRKLTLTAEGLSYGLAMALRLFMLVVFASLLTLTTTPIMLTDGMEKVLSPGRRIGIPAHEIAMMMSIALRFIPTILEEFDRIVLAQRARGADLSKGNVVQRLKAFVPLLVPLFVAAFRRAEDLAQAMEAKCYRGGEGRTRWKVVKWQKRDTVCLIFFLLLLAAAIVERVL